MDLDPVILHFDLDAYYASLAIKRNPDLVGKPVVIGPDPKKTGGRGVCLTCSYEARKHGIHSGMPIKQALQLCPDLTFTSVEWDGEYGIRATSRRIHSLMVDFADPGPKYQPAGSDEGYMDVSLKVKDLASPMDYARDIQKELLDKERLTCSVGLGPNKLIAKIASDYKKPAGITWVRPEEVKNFLAPLSVRKIIGIGPKTEQRLKNLGISIIEDIRNTTTKLRAYFSPNMAEWIIRASYGEITSEIKSSDHGMTHRDKSVSHEGTFAKDLKNWSEVEERVIKMTKDNCNRILNQNLTFQTVSIKIRFADFETHTKSYTFPHPITNSYEAEKVALKLLRVFRKKTKIKTVRLVGSRLSNLKKRNLSLDKWLSGK